MAQFKVVITDLTRPDYDLEKAELHDSGLDIELVFLDTRSPEEIIQGAADADGLMVQFAQITRQVIQHLDRCRVISRYGIGVDMVDLNAASERGILVCNVPDFCIEEVSTHTIGFLICLNRHIHYHDKMVRSGNWLSTSWGPPRHLPGRVLGLVGLGNIGKAVARKAQCLGLRVLAYDPYIPEEQGSELGVELVNLEDLLRRSDFVSLHCPLTDETRHLIGQAQLELMPPSAFLINMSRGPVVDQPALYQALANHTIAGAALDVFEEEPPPPDEPLLQLENLICTPHVSSWSDKATSQLRRDTARNLATVLKGQIPGSVVNRKELNLPDTTP
jgi:D-3-phosphoglycerate dehydrogenase